MATPATTAPTTYTIEPPPPGGGAPEARYNNATALSSSFAMHARFRVPVPPLLGLSRAQDVQPYDMHHGSQFLQYEEQEMQWQLEEVEASLLYTSDAADE